MATESPGNEFGRVSRLRGQLFESVTFAASITGILALAALLIYVTIDAFDLEAASPEWLLVYFVTLVLPYIGFCLYETDRAIQRRTALILAGGLVITAVVFTAVEAFVRPIPGLTWQLVYLFLFVVPVAGYVTVAGSNTPTGAVGFGLLGRIAGGAALGLWLFIIFVVFDLQMYFLVYTVGVFPTALVWYAVRRWNVAARLAGSRVDRDAAELLTTRVLVGAVGVVGTAGAVVLRGSLPVYPTDLIMLAWSLVAPVTAVTTVLTARRYDRRRGVLVGAAVLLVALGGGFGLSVGALSQNGAVLLLLGVSVPTATYLNRVWRADEGRAGLALPLLIVAGALAGAVLVQTFGIQSPDPWLDLSYIRGTPTTQTTQARSAGLFPAIVGSVLLITLTALISFVLGVGTAVFLEEYTRDSGVIGAISRLIQVNIANLAAVPSVVYGLLGLAVFVNFAGFGVGTAISASLTLSLLILPITVISAQEAIRSIPDELRDGSLAMGATRWQTTKNVVLPEAMPGILTGIILALGRAIGETAPLIMIGMATIAFSPPSGLFSQLSAMPMLIYSWANNPSPEFRFGVVAAGVLTLLSVLLAMNATAIIIRNKYERDA
ncbi:phosphate ABC transporter permease PstA [Halovenus sp. WSH3]|uniref:Phosphate transport system permease protein PstA n=1 Tax=Halovenus carboxidivorans TaxID=2692199 RepID=A0A6B0T438_9EURY|nr:phosphate ABC transporter permease PstA [Halovenus carboxidivorans]MXR53058.1 phosphate ABC transporter permease PstA [Halovenus carboxidivorans]